jgi:hypothetical protein
VELGRLNPDLTWAPVPVETGELALAGRS